MTLAAPLLLAGCASAVEHVPLAEPVIERPDGGTRHAPHPGGVRVSRDGRVIAFVFYGSLLGLPGDVAEFFLIDRVDGVVGSARSACGTTVSGLNFDWNLSEDGRYLMQQHSRVDLATCEVTEVAEFDSSDNNVYFADGSGVSHEDFSIPGIRVTYYDGRPDVSVEIPGIRRLHWVSDRSGHRLFVSRFERRVPDPPNDLGHWMVSLPDGMVTPVDLDGVLLQQLDGRFQPGVFSDDGSAFYVLTMAGIRRLDAATMAFTDIPGSPHSFLSAPLDDDRLVMAMAPVATASHALGYFDPFTGLTEWMVSVAPPGELAPMAMDASLVGVDERFGPFADHIVAAPASRELFVTLAYPLELVVVQIPPMRTP